MAKKTKINARILGDTANLSNDEWLKWRAHGPAYADPLSPDYIPVTVGGSDCSAVLGDNPWKSRLELFHEKSGTAKAKIKREMDEEMLQIGHELEEYVARRFLLKMKREGVTNITLKNDTSFFQHLKYPFMVANMDRIITVNGEIGILECKTTSSIEKQKLWKKGICPKEYEWQCRFYMAVADVDFCYICCCWGLGYLEKECAVILIKRDKAIEEEMIKELCSFVENCEYGIEPEPQTTHMNVLANYYMRLYGTDGLTTDNPPIELPDNIEMYELVEKARLLQIREDEAQEHLEAIKQEGYAIAARLVEMAQGKTNCASYRLDDDTVCRIKVHVPSTRASFDVEKFKADHPFEYDAYCEPTLNLAKLRKEQKFLVKDYEIPSAPKLAESPYIKEVETVASPIWRI